MCRTVFKLRALSVGYQIIYADPPWEYGGILRKNSGAADHYDTMNTKAICEMNVRGIADQNCVLFIWGTWPKLPDTLEVLRAWGFEYKTVAFVWVKTNKRKAIDQGAFWPEDSFDEFFGLGKWTRSNTEFCLIGVRGSVRAIANNVRQIIYAPIQEHSRKPEETRERIVKLIGDVPRLEMFARRSAAGWDAYGNEIESAAGASKLKNKS